MEGINQLGGIVEIDETWIGGKDDDIFGKAIKGC